LALAYVCALVAPDARAVLGRRGAIMGGLSTLLLPLSQQNSAFAATPPPPGLDSSARYMPRGGPGGLPMAVSKDTGVAQMEEARAQLVEFQRVSSEGSKLCGVDSLGSVRAAVDNGAGQIAMDGGKDAYTVINLKRSALRPVVFGTSPECEEIQMRQSVDASIKAVDEIIKIGKTPTKRDPFFDR
jgi:hypothetical protein